MSNCFYEKKLRVVRANTLDIWRTSVALHTQVYCKEQDFGEDLRDHSDPDHFDDLDESQSRRVVVFYGNEPVATTRILLPGEIELPAVRLDPALVDITEGASYVECSGFCCSRQRKKDAGVFGRRLQTKITLLLVGAVCALACEQGASHVVMVLEPWLMRRLALIGAYLEPVGEPVEYHGLRQVTYGNIREFLLRMKHEDPECWKTVTNNDRLSELLTSAHPQETLTRRAG